MASASRKPATTLRFRRSRARVAPDSCEHATKIAIIGRAGDVVEDGVVIIGVQRRPHELVDALERRM
jgi:hypothetical protein